MKYTLLIIFGFAEFILRLALVVLFLSLPLLMKTNILEPRLWEEL